MTTALAATPDPVLRFVMTETKNPHPTDGDYVREWYMARLGPTTTALLQMLARIGAAFPPGQVVTVPAVDVASKLGVGFKGGTNSPKGTKWCLSYRYSVISPGTQPTTALL